MRDIAIVGSGIAGLVAAHALRRAGQDVTIYSDRSAEAWLHESRPTGTAARFDMALAYERELGLNHWDDVAPRGEGVFLTFCPTLHKPRLYHLGVHAGAGARVVASSSAKVACGAVPPAHHPAPGPADSSCRTWTRSQPNSPWQKWVRRLCSHFHNSGSDPKN